MLMGAYNLGNSYDSWSWFKLLLRPDTDKQARSMDAKQYGVDSK